MFKFDFDIDDADDQVVVPPVAAKPQQTVERAPAQPCHSISLSELIKLLPDSFSYSPLAHPRGGAPLLRRDLFDARFQIAQAGEESEQQTDGYVDADTDLIPGTYEGGLKSWEGGLDLVEVLARNVGGDDEEAKVAAWVRGSRVLEVGCGTGLPTAYILRALLSSPSTGTSRTVLHVQDYNLPVLSLVTLPNILLASLTSLPASARTAEATAEEEEEYDEDDDEDEERPEVVLPFDPNMAGNLDVSPALLDAFTSILEERGIELRFTYGDWSGMAHELEGEEPYGLILTAETIYAEESVMPLIDVLQAASRHTKATPAEEKLEDSLASLNVRDEWASTPLSQGEPVILVAAKVLYFGVGGGLESFLALIASAGGWSSRVHNWVMGVGRAVVRVGW